VDGQLLCAAEQMGSPTPPSPAFKQFPTTSSTPNPNSKAAPPKRSSSSSSSSSSAYRADRRAGGVHGGEEVDLVLEGAATQTHEGGGVSGDDAQALGLLEAVGGCDDGRCLGNE